MKLLLAIAMFLLMTVCGLPLCAQGLGVPIERDETYKLDSTILSRAKVLRDSGRLKLTDRAVREQLKVPVPGAVDFPAAKQQLLSGREIAKAAREAHVRVGWYYRCLRCDSWHLDLAGGYAVAKDAVATCYHCVEPNDEMREGFLIAVDHTGEVLPVTAVLAKSHGLDGAILRVEGGNLAPLPMSDDVFPGDPVYCFSTPLGQSGYFSEGIVNRFYWEGRQGKDGESGQWRTLRINVSTDWAPGSSGAAVLDRAGNAIGHVQTIDPLSEEQPAPQKSGKKGAKPEDRFNGATLITLHAATPARGMLELIMPLRNYKPGDVIPVEVVVAAAERPRPGSLKIGSPAPALRTGKWVQGEPVKEFEKGKVYVLAFWATWAGPCQATIQHLNELHKKFAEKGVVIFGQNCWEQAPDEVPEFVKEMGDRMTFPTAFDAVDGDDPNDGAMAMKWMEAAGQEELPCAFVVNQTGTIVWIGNPSDIKDATIEKILAGRPPQAKSRKK